MRMAGQGMPGPKGVEGASPGDLLVDLVVEPSPVFERDGAHLTTTAPVDFTDAILGGYIKCAPARTLRRSDRSAAGRAPIAAAAVSCRRQRL
jgi:DnaJ-class molecular chaperone